MNIAHINLAKGIRGGENQTIALIEGLKALNVKQTLVCRKNSLLEKTAIALNINTLAIRKPFLLSAGKLKAFDLLHVHEGRSIYLALLTKVLFKVPYIVTRRVLNKPHDKKITRLAYHSASCIISISNKINQVMNDFSPNKCNKVIPSSARHLTCNKETVEELKTRFVGKFIIGHAGALDDKVKNQSLIIEAAKQLTQHKNIVFILLGAGKDDAKLKALASSYRLDNIIFEGYQENIADYYALFDIFVYPSKEEGLGSAILEAFYFKLPVIAANVGGIPDIIGDNEYGLLIDPNDSYSLVEAMTRLYSHRELLKTYGELGFKRKDDFASETISNAYLKIYQHVLQTV